MERIYIRTKGAVASGLSDLDQSRCFRNPGSNHFHYYASGIRPRLKPAHGLGKRLIGELHSGRQDRSIPTSLGTPGLQSGFPILYIHIKSLLLAYLEFESAYFVGFGAARDECIYLNFLALEPFISFPKLCPSRKNAQYFPSPSLSFSLPIPTYSWVIPCCDFPSPLCGRPAWQKNSSEILHEGTLSWDLEVLGFDSIARSNCIVVLLLRSQF